MRRRPAHAAAGVEAGQAYCLAWGPAGVSCRCMARWLDSPRGAADRPLGSWCRHGRHRPAADKSGPGLGRYHPIKRSGPPRGSMAGLAGQISSGQIGVGGLDGQFRAARAAGGARGGQFRRTGQASTPARRWPAVPAAATAAVSRAVPRPQQGR